MKMVKKRKLILAFVLMIVILLVFHWNWKKHKAIHVAEDYLHEKYNMKFEYVSVSYHNNWIGPAYYSVKFKAEIDNSIVFQVTMNDDLDINRNISSDGFFESFIRNQIEDEIGEVVYSLWDTSVTFTLSIFEKNSFDLAYSEICEKDLSFSEAVNSIDEYWIRIDANYLASENFLSEAKKVYELNRVLESKSKGPYRIDLYYNGKEYSTDSYEREIYCLKELDRFASIEEIQNAFEMQHNSYSLVVDEMYKR